MHLTNHRVSPEPRQERPTTWLTCIFSRGTISAVSHNMIPARVPKARDTDIRALVIWRHTSPWWRRCVSRTDDLQYLVLRYMHGSLWWISVSSCLELLWMILRISNRHNCCSVHTHERQVSPNKTCRSKVMVCQHSTAGPLMSCREIFHEHAVHLHLA